MTTYTIITLSCLLGINLLCNIDLYLKKRKLQDYINLLLQNEDVVLEKFSLIKNESITYKKSLEEIASYKPEQHDNTTTRAIRDEYAQKARKVLEQFNPPKKGRG